METDKVLDFLRYGGDAAYIAALTASCTAPFLPSLVALASDSPSPLLASLLRSHPLAPTALAYASLDFFPISQAALELLKEELPPQQPLVPNEVPPQPDESVLFDLSDRKARAKSAIVSLRIRAAEFLERFQIGGERDEAWCQQQKDAGSIWNSKSCLTELTCLLSIAAFRCPKLLTPEDFVWGLLPTHWGFIVLTYVLLNNPLLVRRSLFLLSEFLRTHKDSLLSPEPVQLSTQSYLSNKYSRSYMIQQQGQQNLAMAHCTKQAVLTFLQLGQLSSSLACMCREVLVMNRSCAGTAVYLTIEYIHDELDFFSKVIFSDKRTSEWMLGYLRSAQNDYLVDVIGLTESVEVMEVLHCGSKSNAFNLQGGPLCVRKALLAEAQTVKQQYGWSGQLHGHLRIYCVLIGATELQPIPEELDFWLKSLIDAGRFICERTLRLGIAFLCLMPGLTANTVRRSLFQECVSVLLTRKVGAETRIAAEVEEQIVWFSVQLFLRRFSEIEMVVREVMGMNVTIQSVSIRELHDAAMAVEAISELSMLMQAVVALRPKGPLSSKTRHGHYMLECLEQLLKSGHFSRNGVDVSGAILHCISVSTTPIHGLLIQVIQAYTEAPATIVHGRIGSQMFRMPPLPRSFLEDSMKTIPSLTSKLEMDGIDNGKVESTTDILVREVLTSYYLLCTERVLRGGACNFESSLTLVFSPLDCEGSWWTALLSRIPFHQLLHHMEKRWLDFVNIFPQWLSLAVSLFPERLVVPDLLAGLTEPFAWCKEFDEELESDDKETLFAISAHPKSGSSPSHSIDTQAPERAAILNVDLARRAMDDALINPLPALQILSFSNLKSSSWGTEFSKELLDYQVFIIKELVPKLLDPLCARCLQEKFCAWFKSLQPLLRQKLLPVFVEVILDTSLGSEITSETGLVTAQLKAIIVELNTRIGAYNNLVQQPLILLACKLEVYRTPLLSIILDVLHELRTVNRRVCLGVVSEGVAIEQTLKSEEVTSALLAQDSAMCQILLEACLPMTGLGDNLEPGPLLEAQKMICGFLTLLLESNNVLLKLLHLQGYDPQLVSMMVKEVPAMVECLNFVPELLQQQQQSKQVFTIILVANIACTHVELPQSLAAVQKALLFVQRNVCGSSSFMQGVLGALVQCACVFSAVADDVVNILQGCLKSSGPVKPGGSPSDPMLHTATLSAFKRLLQQKGARGKLSETSFSTVPGVLHET